MISVFIISTQENWPNMMFNGMDSNTNDIVILIYYLFHLLSLMIIHYFIISLIINLEFLIITSYFFLRVQFRIVYHILHISM